MKVKVLRGRIPNGYRPQRQTIRRSDVVGVAEWTRQAAYEQFKPSDDIHVLIYLEVAKNPGVAPRDIAKDMGVHESRILSALAGMDAHGLLLYENNYGRLFPFGKDD